MEENKEKFKKPTNAVSVARYFGMAFELFATVAVAALLGQWLDGISRWETPVFTAFLIPVFLIGYLYRLYLQLNKKD